MANYTDLQEAIDAGLSNMTVLRNHVRNDDSTSTYPTGIDWFHYNNLVVSNLYSNGNSWIGLGGSGEHIQINRRDCAVWDEYKETGTIGILKFFKFTWKGTSAYSASYERVDAYQLYYDVFLFSNNQVFINYYKVPTSSFQNSNSFGGVGFSVTAGVPCEFTFTPSDPNAGTGWYISTERPSTGVYKPRGSAIFDISDFSAINNVDSSIISWNESVPSGTTLVVSAKINSGEYRQCTSGMAIPLLRKGTDLSSATISVKVEMTTEDIHTSPSLSDLKIKIKNLGDGKIFTINLNSPSIRSAIGNGVITYDGNGTLAGEGGPVEAFVGEIELSGMTWAGHQNDVEHIDYDMSVNPSLLKITYHYTKEDEHINYGMSANAVLTYIGDL